MQRSFFASAIFEKDYVGFYYMPVSAVPQVKALFKPELLKLLRRKSCFQAKSLDDKLTTQIRQVPEDGFRLYQERRWI